MNTKEITGTKDVFIKSIRNKISSPIDKLLHDLEYDHYDMAEGKCNVWNKLDEVKIIISDSVEITEAYEKLKLALREFEDITGVVMKIRPRDEYGDYNTIVDKRER